MSACEPGKKKKNAASSVLASQHLDEQAHSCKERQYLIRLLLAYRKLFKVPSDFTKAPKDDGWWQETR